MFLYNGSESGDGTIGENEYNEWLLELGVDEKVLDNAMFYDKGYSFFRDCMDSRVDEEDIVELVKLMMNNGIYDGRDINKEMWDEFVKKTHNNKIRKFIEDEDGIITIPELIEFINNYSNIILTGGGEYEC